MSCGRFVCGTVLLACLGGCGPSLSAVSTPPPTRTGSHSVDLFDDDQVRLSQGIAVAFDCADIWTGEPCSIAAVATDNKKVARVYPAFLERERTPWGVELAPRSAFVLTGVAPGETTMTVSSASGTRALTIIVE